MQRLEFLGGDFNASFFRNLVLTNGDGTMSLERERVSEYKERKTVGKQCDWNDKKSTYYQPMHKHNVTQKFPKPPSSSLTHVFPLSLPLFPLSCPFPPSSLAHVPFCLLLSRIKEVMLNGEEENGKLKRRRKGRRKGRRMSRRRRRREKKQK